MNKRDEIIAEYEKHFGIECDVNKDFDYLCDGDDCRVNGCDCWTDLTTALTSHLEDKKEKLRLRGSMTGYDLRQLLDEAYDIPVFINDKPIHEAWCDGEAFHITTKDWDYLGGC